MKVYLVTLGAGVLVGAVYALLGVRSPAPPLIPLLGLLGMLVGEQLVPLASRLAAGERVDAHHIATEVLPKITGAPPGEPPTESHD
jgi:XapX domain-containing protein